MRPLIESRFGRRIPWRGHGYSRRVCFLGRSLRMGQLFHGVQHARYFYGRRRPCSLIRAIKYSGCQQHSIWVSARKADHRDGRRVNLIKITHGSKGAVAGVADDDVVDHFQLQQLPCPDEVPSDPDVCLRRLDLARRVVVHQNERAGIGSNRGPEDFGRVYEHGIHDSNRHQMMPLHGNHQKRGGGGNHPTQGNLKSLIKPHWPKGKSASPASLFRANSFNRAAE